MRDIKFRGKRVDNGEWVYGNLIKRGAHYYIVEDKDICHMLTCKGCSATGIEVIPETVGQYTGLKDKNGKEIYGGDVYHQGDKNIRYIVAWHDTGLIGKQIGSSSYAGLGYWQSKIEVNGNIHDNPELLEVSEC